MKSSFANFIAVRRMMMAVLFVIAPCSLVEVY
jgi:hypothetical protein